SRCTSWSGRRCRRCSIRICRSISSRRSPMAANGSSATTSCRRCHGGWSSWSIGRLGSTPPITGWRRSRWWRRSRRVCWTPARPLVGGVGALVAVLFLDGLHYFHFTAAKFNHDVIQLPLWAFAGYAFHAALRRGRMAHWLLLGVAIGLSLWAKYFVVALAAP